MLSSTRIVPWILILALGLAWSTADAKNPIRRDFFSTYPAADGTALGSLPSNSEHCGMCHFDFNGGGDRNDYGARVEQLRAQGSSSVDAFLAIEAEDSDGDGFDNLTEITDTASYPNTPTFPGLATEDLGAIGNIPVSEVSPHVTPTSSVDTDPPVVTVTSPTAGQSLAPNATTTVTWTTSDASPITSIRVEHSDDGGSDWKPVSFDLADDGSYAWFVPARPGTVNRIRVLATDSQGNLGTGESAGDFTIEAVTGGRVPTSLRDVDLPGTQPFEGPVLADPDDNCALCHGNYDTAVEPWATCASAATRRAAGWPDARSTRPDRASPSRTVKGSPATSATRWSTGTSSWLARMSASSAGLTPST